MKWFCFILALLPALSANGQRLPALIPFYHSATGKYGYADSSGRLVIQPQWDKAELFVNGRAYVRLRVQLPPQQRPSEITCIIRPDGSYLVPPDWGRETSGWWQRQMIRPEEWQRKRSTRGMSTNRFGRSISLPISLSREGHSEFEEYLSVLPTFNATDIRTGRRGMIDSSGKVILALEYEEGRLLYDREGDGFLFLGKRTAVMGSSICRAGRCCLFAMKGWSLRQWIPAGCFSLQRVAIAYS